MAEAKTVRLTDVVSGVTVSVSEETAALLSGFEPADDKTKTSRKSTSSTDK